WRWVFLGLVPFVLVGSALMVPVLRSLPAGSAEPGSRLADPRRIVPALGVAAGVSVLEQGGQHPSAPAVAGAVAGLAVVVWGLYRLLPRGAFVLRPGPAAPVAMRGLLAGAFFGVESIIPLSLTVQHHYGATEAGLPLTVAGLTWAVGSWLQGRDHPGSEERRRIRLLRAGMACIALAAGLVAIAVQPGAPGWLMYPAWSVAGFGAGLAMSTVSILLLKFTNDADRGADSA